MRIFVSIDITNKQVIEFVKHVQSNMRLSGKPVRLDQLHITMVFLGEIPEGHIPSIMQALKTIKMKPFKITFTTVGAFPRPKKPSVVWIGPDKESSDYLKELSERINAALYKFGHVVNKKFQPHMTFFRVKNGSVDITEELKVLNNIEIGNQLVDRIRLKKSTLLPDGSRYTILDEVVFYG